MGNSFIIIVINNVIISINISINIINTITVNNIIIRIRIRG